MNNQYLYLAAVIVVCWAVIFTLRALPFIFFGSRKKPLPPRLEWFFGNVLSPLIIAAVIVWAYSGLEYKTLNPYIAGLLTIGVQLWRRNALTSVIVGTLAYMTLVNLCGCASQRIVSLDKNDPSIHVTRLGVKIDENFVEIEEVPRLLLENDIPKSRVIHILVDDDLQELQTSRTLMGYLAKAGYSRPVLVTKRHAEVEANRKVDSKNVSAPSGAAETKRKPKKIRYKKANR